MQGAEGLRRSKAGLSQAGRAVRGEKGARVGVWGCLSGRCRQGMMTGDDVRPAFRIDSGKGALSAP